MGNKFLLQILLFALLILVVFRSWFLPGLITGGDLWYFFPSMYDNHLVYSYAWLFFAGNGFGAPSFLYQAIELFFGIIFFFGKPFGIPWEILERVFILFPFLITGTVFPCLFFKKSFPKNSFFLFSSLIFLLNTYALMLVSGGLVIIGIAYSFIPLVFLLVTHISEDSKDGKIKTLLPRSIILGLVLGVQAVIDVRVSYMTLFGIGIVVIFNLLLDRNLRSFIKFFIFSLLVPLVLEILLNAFWIIPMALAGSTPLGQLGNAFNSAEAVRFFSFAKLENTISLLHPNWPENIFGKVYFQRPEFMVLPMLAFASLLFVKKENKKIILPTVCIALFAIFLSKGTSDPFGDVYLFIFNKVPGFTLFRDPTKWYTLIAFAFSILIPFTLFEVSRKIKKWGFLVPFLFILYFCYIISPAILGELSGTLHGSSLPDDYKTFESFLSSQSGFSRVLWIPVESRFSYFTSLHPAVSGDLYFNTSTPSAMASALRKNDVIKKIAESSIAYIAIPSDSRGEIYLKDRKYNVRIYNDLVNKIQKEKNIPEVGETSGIKVFRVPNSKDHFWSNNNDLSLSYKVNNSTDYKLEIKNAKPGDRIIFTDSYNSAWYAKRLNPAGNINSKVNNMIQSTPYNASLNGFILREGGDYDLEIFYMFQKRVEVGMIISLLSLTFTLIAIGYTFQKNK